MVKKVTVPACTQHDGVLSVDINLNWACPTCGKERGRLFPTFSYDGSRRLAVDGWNNPCGHVDFYSSVRREAAENGLNNNQM
jgi:hypothetical protein